MWRFKVADLIAFQDALASQEEPVSPIDGFSYPLIYVSPIYKIFVQIFRPVLYFSELLKMMSVMKQASARRAEKALKEILDKADDNANGRVGAVVMVIVMMIYI